MRTKSMQVMLAGVAVVALAVMAYAQESGSPPRNSAPADIGMLLQRAVADGGLGTAVAGGSVSIVSGEFTIGSDGTIYIMTYVAATSKAGASTILTAYSGTDGLRSWSVTLPAGNLCKPVQAPDGRLFLLAAGHPGYIFGSAGVAAENAQFFIVTTVGSKQGTYTTMALPGEMASQPVFYGNSQGYFYYVTITSFSQGASRFPLRTNVLYAYNQSDVKKFSIVLNQ
jgi:hypothetical protein